MTSSSDRAELVRLVHRRADVLTAVADGPVEKRELVSVLALSRSTVDRALRELRTHALVDRAETGYVATLPGRLALAEHDRGVESIAAARRAREVLAHLPPDAPIDPALLRDAEVHVAEPPVPRRPLERLTTLVEAADRYRGFTTAVLDPGYVEDVGDRVRAGEIDVEVIYTPEIASYLAEAHEDAVAETLAEGGHTMYVVDEVPFGFGILYGESTHVYVLAAGEDGSFKGLLLNDDPTAIAWAEDLYDRYRERADAFDPRADPVD